MAEISMLEALGDVMRAGKEYTNSKQIKDDELSSAIENVYGGNSFNDVLGKYIVPIFFNGKWYNEDKFTPELCGGVNVIEDGTLDMISTSQDFGGLTIQNLLDHAVNIAICINSGTGTCQDGQAMANATLPNIVTTGAGRLSYTNYNNPKGMLLRLISSNNKYFFSGNANILTIFAIDVVKGA